MPAQVNLTTEQKVKITIAPTTMTGYPATLDGEPVWTVESGDCTVEPEEGGLSAYILSGDEIGESVIKVAADADLDDTEVRTIEDLVTVNVTNAEAANLGLTVGAPEPKETEGGEGEVDPNAPHPDQTLPGDLPGARTAKAKDKGKDKGKTKR